MNLLQEDWITIRRRSGWVEKISPMRLTANQDDPAVEVEAPRADFRGAICQFLVGLLQTTMAPADERAWRGLWDSPPGQDVLSSALESFLPAFELESAGPAFMQDFDLPMADPVGIAALLIDAPGEKTIGENKDHFVHRCSVRGLCEGCAAVALFTLQINAPSGGQGNRVSVRGGGPLTTLLLPVEAGATLWRKLWLNVLPETALGYPVTNDRALVLPWLGKTRTSEPGGVGDTTPDLAHPMQAYWSMPRRIRLDFAAVDAGVCDLCGLRTERLLRRYRAKNYGVNYMGAWLHPLSPYNYDARGEKPPLAVKGQRGGIGYRHWLGLTLGANERVPDAALVVKRYMRQRRTLPLGAEQARLWCFGYDLDNMKARCWYDSILPVYGFESDEQRQGNTAVVGCAGHRHPSALPPDNAPSCGSLRDPQRL